MLRTLFVDTTECVNDITIDNSLRTLQRAVGGYIQTIPIGKDYLGIVDEEGLLKDRDANVIISDLVGTVIVGNALIVRKGYEDFESLTDEDVDKLLVMMNVNICR